MPDVVTGVIAGVSLLGSIISSQGGDDYGAEGANDASAYATRLQSEIAKKQYQYWEKTFQPLEEQIVAEAKDYGGPEDQEIQAGIANADVTQSYDRAERELEMKLAPYGPESPNYATAIASLGLSEAGTRAGAMTTARRTVRDLGMDRRTQAANLGRGLPSQALTGLSSSAGQSATLANNMFNQGRIAAQDSANAIAPITSAASKGIQKWWANRTPATTTQASTVVTPPSSKPSAPIPVGI
jgi:hypothetical protein